MKKSRFTESQIIKVLKENEQGRAVGDIARELGIDKSTIYYWRKRYGGMETSQLKRLKELEEETVSSSRCTQMLAWITKCLRIYCQKSSKAFRQEAQGGLFDQGISGFHTAGLWCCGFNPFNVVLPN